MKKFFVGIAILSTMTASAGTHNNLKYQVSADTKELCELASETAFERIESKLREQSGSGIFIDYMSVCKRNLLGKYKKVIKLKQVTN